MPGDDLAGGPAPSRLIPRILWSGRGAEPGMRDAAEETPVALVHDATTTAVMMATPADLEDLALGFTLTERIAASAGEVTSVEVVLQPDGIEARVWLDAPRGAALAARRRQIAGPTGCGLCGLESLAEAARAPAIVGEGLRLVPSQVHAALEALPRAQPLGAGTHAVHAAGWWSQGRFAAVREDVGRHNALDKLAGALARAPAPAEEGFLVLSSRVSIEMVQKAAVMGAQVLVAVSAPTALAVRTAEAAGMTLIAVARHDSFEVFTRPDRIAG